MDLIPRKLFFDDVFDEFAPIRREQNLKCDIYEKNGDYHIEMDVPGYSKEEISIEADEDYLTITAEKKSELNESDEEKNYVRRERSYGKLVRSFHLGDLDQNNIEASFNDGVLSITVPKKEIVDNKKTIEIK